MTRYDNNSCSYELLLYHVVQNCKCIYMTSYAFHLIIACPSMRYGPNCELTCKMNCLNQTCDSKSGTCPVTESVVHVCTKILSEVLFIIINLLDDKIYMYSFKHVFICLYGKIHLLHFLIVFYY